MGIRCAELLRDPKDRLRPEAAQAGLTAAPGPGIGAARRWP